MTDDGAGTGAAADSTGKGPLGLGIPLGTCQLPHCGQPVPQPETGRPALYHSAEHKAVADKLRRRYGANALAMAAADPNFDPNAVGPPRLTPAETTLAVFPGQVPEPLAVLVDGVRAASQAIPALVEYLAERSESGADARVRQAEAAKEQESIRRQVVESEARSAVAEATAAVDAARRDASAAAVELAEAEEARLAAEEDRADAMESARVSAEEAAEAVASAAEAEVGRHRAEDEARTAAAARARAEAAHAEATQEVGHLREDLADLRRQLGEQQELVRAAERERAEVDASRLVTESRLEDAGRRIMELEDRLAATVAAGDRRVAEIEQAARRELEAGLAAQRALTKAAEDERDRVVVQLERMATQLESALARRDPVPPGP